MIKIVRNWNGADSEVDLRAVPTVHLTGTWRHEQLDQNVSRMDIAIGCEIGHSPVPLALAIILLSVPARPQSAPSSRVSANDLARG